ncbi:MAG TPA: hypothetical protein DIS92_06120 [Alistipes sp.]|nr:hypothetical protein [Alistipes sp.]
MQERWCVPLRRMEMRRSCAQRLERMGVRMSRAVWMGLGALGMSTLLPDGRLRPPLLKSGG